MSLFSAFRSNRDLQERVEKIERQLRASELDWDELYAKCRKLLGRVAKERATMERREDGAPAEAAASIASENGRFGLTTRQRELQQQILRRRAGVQ